MISAQMKTVLWMRVVFMAIVIILLTTNHHNWLIKYQELIRVDVSRETLIEMGHGGDNHTNATFESGDIFVPGSLPISRLEALKKCYVDPTKYQNHFRSRITCVVSEKYNLTYLMVAKAGSSTSRVVMKESFEGEETKCTNQQLANIGTDQDDTISHFTFVREPSSRFLSSYQEAIKHNFYYNHTTHVPDRYHKAFLGPIEQFQYSELFGTDEGRIAFMAAIEDFMQVYNGDMPFDGHLRLQVPRLFHQKSKQTFRLDAVYDIKTMEQNFQELADKVRTEMPPKVVHAYDRGDRRIAITSLSLEARRKICQLTAIDYCCLNYELPPECADLVQCRWIHKPEIATELLIEPVSPDKS